ncbi:hypothetical protein SKAU_G00271910 [Synaphobranchus kaupii]|uniref:Uncharacterized protein n=1 Tax=Synaphobranchus kaupii TaxID=118154 RepID=A0A9Q1IQH0_SYNKA|nr:hypothetical protein SKAU_G00271910 [Synaphobranchus kaupii]
MEEPVHLTSSPLKLRPLWTRLSSPVQSQQPLRMLATSSSKGTSHENRSSMSGVAPHSCDDPLQPRAPESGAALPGRELIKREAGSGSSSCSLRCGCERRVRQRPVARFAHLKLLPSKNMILPMSCSRGRRGLGDCYLSRAAGIAAPHQGASLTAGKAISRLRRAWLSSLLGNVEGEELSGKLIQVHYRNAGLTLGTCRVSTQSEGGIRFGALDSPRPTSSDTNTVARLLPHVPVSGAALAHRCRNEKEEEEEEEESLN